MTLETHIIIIFGGLLLGGLYGLIALGLTMIFGVSKILNVAHGDFVVVGGIFGLVTSTLSGLSPFIILPLVPPLFFAAGVIFEKTMVQRVILKNTQNTLAVSILATLAFAMVVEDLSFFGLGQAGLNYVSLQVFLQPLNILGFIIPTTRFISLVALIILAITTRFIIQSTGYGRRLRATIQDRELAEIVGVNVSRMSALSFGFGAALAGMSGLFLAMITSLTPFQGLQFTVIALTVVILGGLGSFIGSLVGGLTIGIAEAYTAFYMGTNWARIVAIIIMIAVLVIRPSGIFGGRR
ncbi:MAG: branched-chain amino acid ABC transporter permease [Nitrososphaerota archaeon]